MVEEGTGSHGAGEGGGCEGKRNPPRRQAAQGNDGTAKEVPAIPAGHTVLPQGGAQRSSGGLPGHVPPEVEAAAGGP